MGRNSLVLRYAGRGTAGKGTSGVGGSALGPDVTRRGDSHFLHSVSREGGGRQDDDSMKEIQDHFPK